MNDEIANSERRSAVAGSRDVLNKAWASEREIKGFMEPRIVLASASPRRSELLKKAGVKFEVCVSEVDECLTPELESNPREAVVHLAQRKAGVVVQELLAEIDAEYGCKDCGTGSADAKGNTTNANITDCLDGGVNIGKTSKPFVPILVIGADTMVVLNCEIFGKPRNVQHAREMLQKLSGNTHEVMTGVSMWLISESVRGGQVENGESQFVNPCRCVQDSELDNKLDNKLDNNQHEHSIDSMQSKKQFKGKRRINIPAPSAVPELNVGMLSFVDVSEVTFNKLSLAEINDYLKCGESYDKAGAYAAQGVGAKLIKQIDGNLDTVIGLPIERMLRDYGEILGMSAE